MTPEVAGRVGELGEDQDLLVGQRLRLEQADKLLELVVVLRLELPGLVQELHDLVEVEEGLGHHLLYVVILPVEALDRVDHFLGNDVFVIRLLAFLAPQIEVALDGVAQDLGVLRLPALKALLLGVALAVNLEEGEQFLEQAVAGKLEGGDGTLEALEEVGPDEAYHLSLAVLLERVDVLILPPVPMEGIVHRKREQQPLLREGVLEPLEHAPVGLSDRVRRDLRVPSHGKGGCFAVLPNLALAGVRAAPLDNELAEDLVGEENSLGFRHVLCGIRLVLPHSATEHPFHLVEVRPQVVHAYRAREVGLVAAGEELGHVAEVAQTVVDGGGRQHEHGLGAFRVVEQFEQAVVARRFDSPCRDHPGVPDCGSGGPRR